MAEGRFDKGEEDESEKVGGFEHGKGRGGFDMRWE